MIKVCFLFCYVMAVARDVLIQLYLPLGNRFNLPGLKKTNNRKNTKCPCVILYHR